MKKTIFSLLALFFAFTWQVNAQAVNEPANWPNANWTLDTIAHTGSNAMDIEADPTTSDHFAYDDDDTGSSSHDEIAAESPVIDLSAAQSAGENYIVVSGAYVYNNISSSEKLSLDYWDADASAWVTFYEFPHQDTPGAPNDDYCSGTPQNYTASLDISSFTASQLSGFKYRIYYNDNTSGNNAWNWGFCFSSPELHSTATLYSNPTFTTTVNADCNNDQFSVDVEVTDLGGASSVTVADDQGSASQQLTAPGTVTFGPYASGTTVVFTVTNDDDNSYESSETVEFYCPPANDNCDTAEALTIGQSCSPVTGTNQGATDSGVASPSCSYYQGGDVWYTVTASTAIDTLIVETSSVSGSNVTDTGMAIYTGDCSNLTEVACDDDGGSGLFSKITLSNVAAGTTYYVRVFEYGNSSFGEFGVCAYAPNLSSETLSKEEFTFWPNPADDKINFSANGSIDRIEIVSLTGQVLLSKSANDPIGLLDISSLKKGVYLLNVYMNDKKGVYRIIKK